MAWAIFSSLASLASIFGLAHQLYKHKEKPLTYTLLAISILCSILSGILWAIGNELEQENKSLKDARLQAEQLIKSWPNTEGNNITFVSTGEFRGIVISGMAFLEVNKSLFPETYQTANRLLLNELGATSNTDETYYEKRENLQEAAEAMITTMKAIRFNKQQ